MNFLLLFVTMLLASACNKSSSSSSSEESAQFGSDVVDDFVVEGQLAISESANEVSDESIRLSQRAVEIFDEQGRKIISSLTGDDGSYSFIVPGQLAMEMESNAETSTALVGLKKLNLRSVISDTSSGKVIGVDKHLKLLSIEDNYLNLGETPLEKITALRGKIFLEGASDHSGIIVYVPGTSYSAFTDSAGQFVMTFIGEGTYDLKIEKDGYDPMNWQGAQVASKETTDIGEHKLFLAGGATGFEVTQEGVEGQSQSLEVKFAIKPGRADRIKIGFESELATKSYGPVPEEYTHTFAGDGEYELIFAFATRDGFESQVIKTILVDTTAPDSTGLMLADATTASQSVSNSLFVQVLHPNCIDMVKIAVLDVSITEPTADDFKWGCYTSATGTGEIELPPVSNFDYNIWAMDVVGNVSAMNTGFLQIDQTPPVAPAFVISDQDTASTTYASKTTVNLNIGDCTGVDFIIVGESLHSQPPENAAFVACTTVAFPYTFEATTVGTKTLKLWAKDLAGNLSDSAIQTSIVFDDRLPGIPAFTITDSTSGSAQYTNSVDVRLTVSSCANVAKIFYRESAAAPSLADFVASGQTCSTGVEAFSYSFTDSTQGAKTIYLWAQSTAGIISITSETAAIQLTTTPPTPPSVTFRDPETNSTSVFKNKSITATVNNCSGIAGVLLSFTQTTPPAELSISQSCTTATDAYSVFMGNAPLEGANTPYFWVKDLAGNVAGGALPNISYDSIPPTAPAITIADQTSGSNSGTDITTVDVTIASCAGLDKILISESQTSQPDYSVFSVACSSAPGAFTHTFANNIEGNKTVLLWVTDLAGNVSTVASTATIAFDKTRPNAPSFVLSDPTPANSGYSNSLTLVATPMNCTDITQVMVNETQTTEPGELDAGWVACDVGGVTATAIAAGTRTLYLWAKDIAGNVSLAATSAAIEIDTTAPTAPTLTLADPSLGAASHTNEQTVAVAISSCADSDKVFLSLSNTTPEFGDFSLSCATSGLTFDLANLTNETKTVYLWNRDTAGNISAAPSSYSIIVDTDNSGLNMTFAVADSSNASTSFTNDPTVDFSLSACTANEILIRESQSAAPAENDASWQSCVTSGTYTLATSSQGSKTIHAWFRDEAGNISATSESVTITYDSIAPSVPSFSVQDDDDLSATGYTNNTTVDITVSSCADIAGILINQSVVTPAEGAISTACTTAADGLQFTIAAPGDGLKSVYLWVKDAAGNVASGAQSITLDTATPVISNARVSDLKNGEFTLSWSTDESVPTTMEWGTDGVTYPNSAGSGSGQAHSVTINSLTPGTKYYYRVTASDYAEHTATAVTGEVTPFKISKFYAETDNSYLGMYYSLASSVNNRDPLVKCNLNGDAYEDIVIAAPSADYGGHTDNGMVQVIFGSASPASSYSLPTAANIAFYGAADSDIVGVAIDCGDFNGDGDDDLVFSYATGFYVVYGGSGISTGILDLATASNYDLTKDHSDSEFHGLAIGKINNDTYVDIVSCLSGICYGYFGSAAPELTADFDLTSSLHYLNYGLTVIDLDNDGLEDVLMGYNEANYHDGLGSGNGAIAVFKGGALSGSITAADYELHGEVNGLYLGCSTGGDFDNDGFTDLLIYNCRSETGYVPYLYFGHSNWGTLGPPAGVDIVGGNTNATFGSYAQANYDKFRYLTSFISAGDIDADGKDDLLLGKSSYSSTGKSNNGIVCLYLNRAQANWASLGTSVDMSEADVCIEGANDNDWLGVATAVVDLNNDGQGEIIFAAPGGDGAGDVGTARGELGALFLDLPTSYEKPLYLDMSPHY